MPDYTNRLMSSPGTYAPLSLGTRRDPNTIRTGGFSLPGAPSTPSISTTGSTGGILPAFSNPNIIPPPGGYNTGIVPPNMNPSPVPASATGGGSNVASNLLNGFDMQGLINGTSNPQDLINQIFANLGTAQQTRQERRANKPQLLGMGAQRQADLDASTGMTRMERLTSQLPDISAYMPDGSAADRQARMTARYGTGGTGGGGTAPGTTTTTTPPASGGGGTITDGGFPVPGTTTGGGSTTTTPPIGTLPGGITLPPRTPRVPGTRPGTGAAAPGGSTVTPAPTGGPNYGPNSGVVRPPNAPPQQFGSGNVVQDYMNQITASNSPYINQARQTGIDMANSRGLLNSSIAGGNAVREAIKAAMPMVSESVGLLKSREGYAAQDWINSNQFNREFSGAMAILPVQGSMDMLNTLMSYAASDPSVYSPEVISGLSNFFQQNMSNIMGTYYGGAATSGSSLGTTTTPAAPKPLYGPGSDRYNTRTGGTA